ncbi:SufD family Fe-S cluster assembly protein [Salmonella enterica subsp. enterica]|nr:SufD family Fe-S cluster assembly protein [Salmonella enterica subsp. enterica]
MLATDASAFSHGFLRYCTSPQQNAANERATLRLNSLAMPVKNEVCDTRTWLEHNKVTVTAASCLRPSSATGTHLFNGLISVAQHAIKTDGQMTNNNLLLETG